MLLWRILISETWQAHLKDNTPTISCIIFAFWSLTLTADCLRIYINQKTYVLKICCHIQTWNTKNTFMIISSYTFTRHVITYIMQTTKQFTVKSWPINTKTTLNQKQKEHFFEKKNNSYSTICFQSIRRNPNLHKLLLYL